MGAAATDTDVLFVAIVCRHVLELDLTTVEDSVVDSRRIILLVC